MKADEKLAGADILCAEPLVGYSPSDIQQWILENNHTDASIAEAMAAVKSKTGWLRHELDDSDNDNATKAQYHEEFNDWWELEQKLVAEIICRLEQLNRISGTNYRTTGNSLHYIIEPFIEQNGYRDSAGWWVSAFGKQKPLG